MEQRQPGDAARGAGQTQAVEELHDVGDHVAVRDLDSGGHPGRARGVLQVGDVVGAEVRSGPAGAELVGDGVDGDGARTLAGGQLSEELPDPGSGFGRGEDDRRCAVAQDRVEAVVVARLIRVEQWHGDESGLDRGEERHDVVQALRGEDGHAVPRLRDLLQAGRDGVEPLAEPRPRQLVHLTVTGGRVVDVAVDQPVMGGVLARGGDVGFDEVDKGGAIRDDDRPSGVVILLELHVAPFRSVLRWSTSSTTDMPGALTTSFVDPTACLRAHPNSESSLRQACRPAGAGSRA